MEIYFVARSEASVRQFNRRSVFTRSVLRSNQAATVFLRPSYRPVTFSLFYRPHCTMIQLVCLTARASHVCRHPAQPPDHLPVSYYLADAALSASPSVVRPPLLSPGSCSACRRSPPPPPVARTVRVSRQPFASTRSFLRFLPRRSCNRLSVVPSLASTAAAAT